MIVVLLDATMCIFIVFFFFNDTATTEIYTLSLHDALPIFRRRLRARADRLPARQGHRPRPRSVPGLRDRRRDAGGPLRRLGVDRKSTRLNSSHANISYAVFCLKKKKHTNKLTTIYKSSLMK